MTLKSRLTEDMKNAMRAHEKEKLGVIRLIQSAIKQYEVDERKEVDDNQVLIILEKMLKQRRESIAQFEQANRQDLLAIEKYDVEIIQSYMPKPLSESEIESIIKTAISKTGAKTMQDMGKIMAEVKPLLFGRADMSAVSGKIKQQLS
ncbi:MAG TPA: GatB/YqeY domain-containing protein [Gammaproteobacteria bacterium]|nr:GatB/YqeY domain-containing protein [Gammaproteobacteria bacterium]